jgi:hypothetical protein
MWRQVALMDMEGGLIGTATSTESQNMSRSTGAKEFKGEIATPIVHEKYSLLVFFEPVSRFSISADI